VPRRRASVLALAVILGGLAPTEARAHAGLRFSNPAAGAALGDTPKVVEITFWEKPEATLSEIRVLDTAGTARQVDRPAPVPDAPTALAVHVRPLEKGVYTVTWRTISSVDGHATVGAFAVGVGVKPSGVVGSGMAPAYPPPTPREMVARAVFIAGLVLLLGTAAATVLRFGGSSDLRLAAAGWLAALAGLVLLAAAQRRNAGASYVALAHTAIGRTLLARAVALLAAGAALATAARSADAPADRIRRVMAGVALAALAAMAVHSAAGHAAASGTLAVAIPAAVAQWTHFAAVGVWMGGLAALLLALRGAPSMEKAEAVARFSRIAAVGLLAVAVTGVWRTRNELSSWHDLASTGYGRTVAVKLALAAAIAALGAFNRWRSVPAAATSLRSLRRAGGGELALAAGAVVAAAVLGTLAPPRSGYAAPTELEAEGADFGTTVRVRLTAASDQPGPNRFLARVVDYDSKDPVPARRVTLRFTPLDDPGVASTSLALDRGAGEAWEGSGPNLAFDGRWRITTRIERERDSVEVPLDVEAKTAPQFVSVERIPGQAPKYTVEVRTEGYVRFSPDSERPGPSVVSVTCYDVVGDERPIEQMVVTFAGPDGHIHTPPLRRLQAGSFVVDVVLNEGRNTLAAVARTGDGVRLRAVVALDVPAASRKDP